VVAVRGWVGGIEWKGDVPADSASAAGAATFLTATFFFGAGAAVGLC